MTIEKRVPYLFALPALALYLFIRIYPMLQSLFYGFTDWDGLSDYDFIGLANYAKLFGDATVANAVVVTLKFAVVTVLSVNLLGLGLALMLNGRGARITAFRSIIFLPVVISQVAVGFIWKNLYSFDGLLNRIVGLIPGAEQIGWLTDPSIAIYGVAFTEIWRTAGFNMVIILAALQTVPVDLYEAASLDGCGPWLRFSNVTLPLILPGLGISAILSSIGALKQFGLVKVLTDGGPLRSTETLSIKILDEAFNYNFQGYAASLATMLFLAILVLVAAQNAFLAKRQVEY